MNKTLRALLPVVAVFLAASSAKAVLISTALTAGASSNPYPGGYPIGNTLNDPFAYNPTNPTATTPVLTGGWFHGDSTTNHFLQYTLSGGPITASGGASQFVVDLWGRSGGGGLEARDNNFTITLYSGNYTTAIQVSALQSIPDTGTPFLRTTFNLVDGTTFDRFEIRALNTQYFTIAETRAAFDATAVPEPSTYGLIGAGALAVVTALRRRRKSV